MIIGLTGCKGVGKDTAAQFLIDHRGYQRMAFADKMKEAVANLFDITSSDVDTFKVNDEYSIALKRMSEYERQMSWREFLQRFGTEMGRKTFGQNFWIDLVLPKDARPIRDTVFTDVRFDNEAIRIIGHRGVIIEITRPGHEPDGHDSETPISRPLIDAVVPNDGSLEQFQRRFLAFTDSLKVGVVG